MNTHCVYAGGSRQAKVDWPLQITLLVAICLLRVWGGRDGVIGEGRMSVTVMERG